jgi:mercuric ion binding protein
MGTIRSIAAVVLMAGAVSAHAGERKVELTVPTMDCDTCPITIRVALMKVHGVKKAMVSYARRNAVVTFDDKATTVAALTKATEEAGYPSFPKE